MAIRPDRNLLDFDLLIETASEGFRARVLRAPKGVDAHCLFSDTIDPRDFKYFAARLGSVRNKTRSPNSEDVQLAKEFGTTLFQCIFREQVLHALKTSFAEAHQQDAGLRITLRLTNSPRLMNYPWELLYDPEDRRFLAIYGTSPIVRYIEIPFGITAKSVALPLRVLVVVAAPKNEQRLDSDQEWKNISLAMEPLVEKGEVFLERLEQPTLARLEEHLELHDYHILHFIGHGGYSSDAQEGFLVFEDEEGFSDHINGDVLGTIIRDNGIRLAVLNACEGARSSSAEPFAGVAQSLVFANIPAVVAMQFEVTDTAAVAFSRALYGSLANKFPIDLALSRARKKMYAAGKALEWATPVLYTRLRDGKLFDFKGASSSSGSTKSGGTERGAPQAPGDTKQEERGLPAREADGKTDKAKALQALDKKFADLHAAYDAAKGHPEERHRVMEALLRCVMERIDIRNLIFSEMSASMEGRSADDGSVRQ
jgi:hypothetical protein